MLALLALLAYLAAAVFLGCSTFDVFLVANEAIAGLFCLVLGVLLERLGAILLGRVTLPAAVGGREL